MFFGQHYAPIVITGMHHSFIAVETQLLADIAKTAVIPFCHSGYVERSTRCSYTCRFKDYTTRN